jgi:Zn-dependent protease with chaperone function
VTALPGAAPLPVVPAQYFDGVSSVARPVRLWVHERQLCLAWSDEAPPRVVPWYDLELSERLAAAPRMVRLPGGGHLEVRRQEEFDRLLEALGLEDGLVARWQRHWPLALLGLAATALLCWGAYLWGVPRVATWVAARTPEAVEATIGRETLATMDGQMLRTSALPLAQQERLRQRLAPLLRREGGDPVRVEFRRAAIGPNAFALPGGVVVVTDALVTLVQDDAAVAAVVAHEVGHVHHRHVLRRLVGAGITGAAGTLIMGDVSGAVAAIPATLADLAYSRDMEREADRHAVMLLRRQGQDPETLAQVLAQLERAATTTAPDAQAPEAESGNSPAGGTGSPAADGPETGTRRDRSRAERTVLRIPDYLSSHPATAERIRAIRGR